MKTLTASILALAMASASGLVSAQSVGAGFDAYPQQDGYGSTPADDGYYDYARVIRVTPVNGAQGSYRVADNRQCRSRDYADDGYYRDGYNGDGYSRGGDYYGRNDGYDNGNGRVVASVVGSVIGALLGSQVGGGSGRIATSAIGSAVGAVAGQQVYENAQRQRNVGRVTVCDPIPDTGAYRNSGGGQYDVTYEYGGRTHTTRTNYHPGNRIRVRVSAL